MSFQYQQLVINRVLECIHTASKQLNKAFQPPKISFNQRGKIAGCARLQTNELRFNPVLLKDNHQLFLDEVVPHEVCHLIAFSMFGKVRPHGKEWKSLMKVLFDLDGQTYHKMDVKKVAGKQFVYQCECGPVELSIRRHNKVKRGEQQYTCRRCQSILTQTNISNK
ncbi:SprT family zinc-dependent metalloprotease [Paraglaciecola aquimarina]|uniref:SprT family zinc-dependent metalloprotease n=1 Tax=Paraglaciecola algarum TaxID=3050085 RepID=A0ABS9DBF9_9ALTE|nr:SprT family zinc-dependent metalloprotease [Paraglaciecola sp. G1-23]MCF2950059.1 SprT family zinc-dependent metalloprotease [Paraglaciecola sp. G1-23]